MKKLIHLLIWLSLPCMAQTAAVAPVTAKGTAAVQSQVITIVLNGKTVRFTVPAQTAQVTVNVPGQPAPVALSGTTGTFNCQTTPGGTFVVNPDQTITATGLTCTITVTK